MSATRETEWQRRTRRERERDAHIALHGNVCELCGNAPKSRGLSEDHDHATNLHRGWLCFRDNRLLLHRWLSPEHLLAAALYLHRRTADRDDDVCWDYAADHLAETKWPGRP